MKFATRDFVATGKLIDYHLERYSDRDPIHVYPRPPKQGNLGYGAPV